MYQNIYLIPVLFVSLFLSSCTPSTDELYTRGEALMDKGEYKEAVKLYDNITKRNSKFEDAYYYKGYCYLKDSNYAKALRYFKHILRMKGYNENDRITIEFQTNKLFDPEAADHEIPIGEVFYQLGVTRYYMDSVSSSYQSFENAIRRNYEKGPCLAWQGLLWLRVDSFGKACDFFEQGKALNNTDADRLFKQYCSETK